MKRIKQGYIFPSAALALKRMQIRYYQEMNKPPKLGDVVFGEISRIGQHSSLENVSGRIHAIHNGTRAIFVFGNRYAPDYYEGQVPEDHLEEVDLLARSGMIGQMLTKNALIKDPTRVKILGYVCNQDGEVINTQSFPRIAPHTRVKKTPRAGMILVCGTSMNSGKSVAATACCRVLTSKGYAVRASKVTGTASLKDILSMNDAGAHPYTDFTYLGYPSTYLLPKEDLLSIFNRLDLKYANNPRNYWVVEFADGIIQRETAMLLLASEVQKRIHKLIFCASDAFSAIGGLGILKDEFNLTPDAISGLCSRSPLHIRELAEFTDIPVFNSADVDIEQLSGLLTTERRVVRQPIAV
ncbi:MAG: hypothetical protein DWQ07_17145 [Chloroflexi bacterium]|nr:MAG: hypothetical protein DWQ07_17145 [Chloroflexota bacterium]MBL1195132.1 hypothetical protein [Chloroflexota bacterium]NOH12417.1 hypothetical protein [Chloroflexota bacterium]